MALWTAQKSQQVRDRIEVANDEGGQAYLSRSLMVAVEGQKERGRLGGRPQGLLGEP